MPPDSGRIARGYVMRIQHLAFTSGLVSGDSQLQGCVSYGQWRTYEVRTSGLADAQLYVDISAAVGGMYAAANRMPTLTDYDLVAQPPLSSLTLSPCDLSEPTRWHIAIHLGDESEGMPETLFHLTLRSASALARIAPSVTYSGAVCCGGWSFWAVPDVPSSLALSVNLSVTSGALHALFLQYDSCPRYTPGDRFEACTGLCTVGWVTRWDRITGGRLSLPHLALTVPMGQTTDETDKRRAGTWYVGVKALPSERADYTLDLSLAAPRAVPPRPYCSGMDRFCASATQRLAGTGSPLTTAGESRTPTLQVTSAGVARAGASPARRLCTLALSILVGAAVTAAQ